MVPAWAFRHACGVQAPRRSDGDSANHPAILLFPVPAGGRDACRHRRRVVPVPGRSVAAHTGEHSLFRPSLYGSSRLYRRFSPVFPPGHFLPIPDQRKACHAHLLVRQRHFHRPDHGPDGRGVRPGRHGLSHPRIRPVPLFDSVSRRGHGPSPREPLLRAAFRPEPGPGFRLGLCAAPGHLAQLPEQARPHPDPPQRHGLGGDLPGQLGQVPAQGQRHVRRRGVRRHRRPSARCPPPSAWTTPPISRAFSARARA